MSATGVTFAVRDIKSGWAVGEIAAGATSVTLDGFSYTTDAFGDLATFALRAALDNSAAEMEFDAEPGGWKLRFESVGAGICHFDVRAFGGLEGKQTNLLGANVAKDDLALAILRCFEAIEDDPGVEQFDMQWMRAYPVRGVAALRTALKTQRRSRGDWDL